MTIKYWGAVLILTACGCFGFRLAAAHRIQVRTLRSLLDALDLMDCELQYHLTPLPELCMRSSKLAAGCIRQVMVHLSEELQRQINPDVASCMHAALISVEGIGRREKRLLQHLGVCLGQFDLPGQIKGLHCVREECIRELEKLGRNQEERLRSYQTLGLCAGAALVILFI